MFSIAQYIMSNICAVVLVLSFPFISCLDEGDRCTLYNNCKQARCTPLLKCPSAIRLIENQLPQACGFTGNVPIVCCENSTAIPTADKTGATSKPTNSVYKNPYQLYTTGHKSFQKCIEYSQLATSCANKEVVEDTCGFEAAPLTAGGAYMANRREFPHAVHVGFNSDDGVQYLSGGSLISERYVLTAGHCLVSSQYGEAAFVRMGITNVKDVNHIQEIAIIERIGHPQFKPPSKYNDIGLLKLKESAIFDSYVRPACLFYDSTPITQTVQSIGWASTTFTGEAGDDLLKLNMKLVDTSTCNDSFGIIEHRLERGIIKSQICGEATKEAGFCQGNGGAPLQIYSKIKCMYDIIGVVSFGKICGHSPEVSTSVSYYMDWLERTVWG